MAGWKKRPDDESEQAKKEGAPYFLWRYTSRECSKLRLEREKPRYDNGGGGRCEDVAATAESAKDEM